MKPKIIPLAHALPQVDRWAVRLLRCAGAARRNGAQLAGWPDLRFGRMSHTSVSPNALTARIATRSGAALLAVEPRNWPALASAATLADVTRRNAVAECLLGERLGGFARHVAHIELEPATAIKRTGGCLALSLASIPVEVLAIDNGLLDAIESWAGSIQGESPESFVAATGGLRLPSRILLASRSIPLARLSSLQSGDALLLPAGSLVAPQLSALLSWSADPMRPFRGFQATVLLAQATMTLTTSPAFQTQDFDQEPPGYRQGDAALDQLTLPVTFELTGPLMRLAELSRLVAGDVIELSVPLEHAEVQIRVAGQGFGIGELVAIGDRLGVRIIRTDPRADAIESATANQLKDTETEMAS